MANDFDNTALNSVIKELWDERIEDTRYATGVIMKNVANKSSIAVKKGDLIHVSIDQKYTVGTVSAAGAFTPQNYAVVTSDITLNQWEQIAIRVLDRAEAQAFWQPGSNFPERAGAAYADRYDAQLAGLYTGITAQVGSTTSPSNFDKNLAQEAMLTLAKNNIPLEDLTFNLNPTAYYNGLCNEEQLTAASKSGFDKNVITTGRVFDLFGTPVSLSTNIIATGTPSVHKNMLLHRSALAIAWQKDGEIEKVRGTAGGILAWIFVAQSLYGLATIRADHGVVINSAV